VHCVLLGDFAAKKGVDAQKSIAMSMEKMHMVSFWPAHTHVNTHTKHQRVDTLCSGQKEPQRDLPAKTLNRLCKNKPKVQVGKTLVSLF